MRTLIFSILTLLSLNATAASVEFSGPGIDWLPDIKIGQAVGMKECSTNVVMNCIRKVTTNKDIYKPDDASVIGYEFNGIVVGNLAEPKFLYLKDGIVVQVTVKPNIRMNQSDIMDNLEGRYGDPDRYFSANKGGNSTTQAVWEFQDVLVTYADVNHEGVILIQHKNLIK